MNMDAERRAKINERLAAMSVDDLRKRLNAMMDYQMSMYRINEISEEADRESDRVFNAISMLNAELTRRKKE